MDHIAVLHRRLEQYASSWPALTRRGLARYGGGARPRRRSADADADRYWTLFPRAIWSAWSPARGRASARFVDDVLWGQYCVFLCVRIHDDLLDGQAAGDNLIFVADDLLLEARNAFSAHVDSARFRAFFDRQLRTTLRAILDVDELQARPGAMGRRQLPLHGRVSAIFTLGAAAACLACRRPAMIPRFERACARLAIAAQILDDLVDVEEDLARGRYNFVANLLGIRRLSRGRSPALARSVIRGDAIGGLLELVQGYARRAARELAAARIAEIDNYLQQWLHGTDHLRHAAHRARVAAVFPGLTLGRRRTASGYTA